MIANSPQKDEHDLDIPQTLDRIKIEAAASRPARPRLVWPDYRGRYYRPRPDTILGAIRRLTPQSEIRNPK